MSRHRFRAPRAGTLLAAAVLSVSACYEIDGCDFTACVHDFDCAPLEICESDGIGTICVAASVCESASDCAAGSECRLRTPSEIPAENGPRHPFDSDRDAKLTCEGLGASASSSGASASGGGDGGAGGDGDGGTGGGT